MEFRDFQRVRTLQYSINSKEKKNHINPSLPCSRPAGDYINPGLTKKNIFAKPGLSLIENYP